MGIYDRGYYPEQPAGDLAPSWNQRSAVANLILVNVGVFIANAFSSDRVNGWLALQALDIQQPWMWWRTLSYAFAHDGINIWHILWNMLGLWFLGRSVEERYGRAEFLRIYLLSALAGGVGWLLRHGLFDGPAGAVLGASGAVCCIQMLFVLNFPKATLLLWGIVPMPAWLLGILLVLGNFGSGPAGIAYDVHLIGILFAVAYFGLRWNFSALEGVTDTLRLRWARWRQPNIRLHRPAARPSSTDADDARADKILQKISEHGQVSLSGEERKFMERYARQMRQRRGSPDS